MKYLVIIFVNFLKNVVNPMLMIIFKLIYEV